MATTIVINGISYTGCSHSDGNEYYCKTSGGTVIETSNTLQNNWSSAIRYMSITIDDSYSGELKWCNTSSGSGKIDIPTSRLNKPCYLAYYKPGASYPFGLSSSNLNKDELDLGWVSEDLFSFFFFKGIVRIYTSSGWKNAIPYVYTSSGWKQTIPYVYTSNGWKIGQ